MRRTLREAVWPILTPLELHAEVLDEDSNVLAASAQRRDVEVSCLIAGDPLAPTCRLFDDVAR